MQSRRHRQAEARIEALVSESQSLLKQFLVFVKIRHSHILKDLLADSCLGLGLLVASCFGSSLALPSESSTDGKVLEVR